MQQSIQGIVIWLLDAQYEKPTRLFVVGHPFQSIGDDLEPVLALIDVNQLERQD